MKIGILTFHEADNLGAVLQAYALRTSIVKICNDSVEIINYHQHFISFPYRVFPIIKDAGIPRLLISIISCCFHFRKRLLKKRKFDDFRETFLQVQKERFDIHSYVKKYDVFVVGSDQVWNGRITHFDSAYFLPFCRYCEKKISYAASIGTDNLSPAEMEFLSNNVGYIDYISVREKRAVRLIEGISGKKVEHVLDPSLLLLSEDWASLCHKKGKKKFLLVYKLESNDEVDKIASRIARILSIEVVIISNSARSNQFGFRKEKNVGPFDFLTMLRDADFVVTNSFHGTSFSVIFKKNFVSIPHKTRGGRMRSLLETLQLENRLVETCEIITEKYPFEVDYSAANEILQKEREKSLSFLKNSIFG